jgi:hypothetical protein
VWEEKRGEGGWFRGALILSFSKGKNAVFRSTAWILGIAKTHVRLDGV